MKNLEERIKKLLEADYKVHHIFKEIIDRQSMFTENEDIIDFVFIKREHLNDRDSNSPIYSSAKIIVATSEGIVFAKEGFEEISDSYLGYKIKHIYYDQISSFELDITLLKGQFKIFTVSSKRPELIVEFNTAEYFKEFEHFINSVRKMRISCSCR